ncbi:uncharacterized protein LOC106153288 [Lingula anatina]|uniref:Uncharacterized protein LOC106153288 n=1 Tax=Lingula anatina TaxID=7574 RepID=A0A1S3H947_LINAN|nr:uncharacterized protein LOC106153288 [Lingula anatina]|eukprot:XP_013382615.1 uncharacterized protein LOC106153288 [Lingula anatina]
MAKVTACFLISLAFVAIPRVLGSSEPIFEDPDEQFRVCANPAEYDGVDAFGSDLCGNMCWCGKDEEERVELTCTNHPCEGKLRVLCSDHGVAHRDPSSCGRFYVCKSITYKHLVYDHVLFSQCPEGTVFNEKKSICDKPVNVNECYQEE